MCKIAPTIVNPAGRFRVVVTKRLPGSRWQEVLVAADCRLEILNGHDTLREEQLVQVIGERCAAVISQLTEEWTAPVLDALASAGGKIISAYAVGHDNIDVAAATRLGLAVGNTPGVLTEATAEMAVALTFSAARRIVHADEWVRGGQFQGWQPTMMLGDLLWRKTLGVIGAGRIGSAYSRMMVEGHKMNLLYASRRPNRELERRVAAYNACLTSLGDDPVSVARATSLDELLREADVVSLHVPLSDETRHLIGARQLAEMKPTAILVNTSRGPVIDEAALVDHCRQCPSFHAALDVFEEEPALHPGLDRLENVVLTPHLGSATSWTREGMAALAALNVVAVLHEWPAWHHADALDDVMPFLAQHPPKAAPSLVNAEQLGLGHLSPYSP